MGMLVLKRNQFNSDVVLTLPDGCEILVRILEHTKNEVSVGILAPANVYIERSKQRRPMLSIVTSPPQDAVSSVIAGGRDDARVH